MTEPAAQATTTTKHKRTSGRSPSYPGINLETAIRRAQQLYDQEKTHETPISVVTKCWGYSKHTTGPASVSYSALIKYGLMTDDGNGAARVAKLTPLAVTILMSPDAEERAQAIRTAALKPTVHAEMWQKYQSDLPSDDTLRYKMAVQGPFTEAGFDDFLRVYKATIQFAKLDSADKPNDPKIDGPEVEDGGDDDLDGEVDQQQKIPTIKLKRRAGSTVTAETQAIAVPMIGAPAVMIEGKFPLTEQDWTYFMTVLNAMKPGLVAEPAEDDDRDG